MPTLHIQSNGLCFEDCPACVPTPGASEAVPVGYCHSTGVTATMLHPYSDICRGWYQPKPKPAPEDAEALLREIVGDTLAFYSKQTGVLLNGTLITAIADAVVAARRSRG